MGFMASYWGYQNMSQVDALRMSSGHELPIDSFIMDYDWFGLDLGGEAVNSSTPECPDYKQGAYTCGDTGTGTAGNNR